MLEPTRRWVFSPPAEVPSELAAAGAAEGLSPLLVGLLASRGCRGPGDLQAFLGDPVAALHDPALLPDALVACDRLLVARSRGKPVMVFGDFDADGLTGLALLTIALKTLGLGVEPYVPSRLDEGHGLSAKAVDAAERAGCRVIVTVDCGTSSRDEVALARSRGIDVIVTDHHHLPAELPVSIALVNPRRTDSVYPEAHLTGAGVAFKVAQLLLADVPGGPEQALRLADLAAIGTIADVAPLLGENRSIVRLGLQRLQEGAARPGLAALLRASGIEAARVDVESVSYQLAPRINAAGRVGEAMVAARLLLAEDAATAEMLAAELDAANRTRRELTTMAVAEARAAMDPGGEQPAVVVAGPWPVGLIGVMAGRLADDEGRPAVVFSTSTSPWRGSARAGGDLDLAAAFTACQLHFVRFGGHAQAAGCDLRPGAYDAFRADFLALAAARSPRAIADLAVDAAIPADTIDYALHRQLQLLEPTGPGNPRPLLGIMGATVTRVRAANGGHAQITISKGREVLDAIAFNRPDLASVVQPGDRLDLVARLTSREFAGLETLQLEIEDAATSGLLERQLGVAHPAGAVASSLPADGRGGAS